MASSSLGTLTLDLAVRLSEFTDGLTQAERQARDSTNNINNTVTANLGKAALAFGAMAATGVAVAGAALVSFTVESAKADVALSIMAKTANTSLKSFQTLSYAAQQLGIEQDALGGILGDVQEKLGEFSATGGGGAADFFEALQNNTKMTDEEIRNLGKTLQGKDGAEAIQLVKDKMDALGATSQEQRFVFESLAGDLGNLMPLFADGGDILNKYGEELEAAGVIKTEAAIEQSRRLTAQTQAVTTQFDGFKTQLASQMMPVLNNLMGYFVQGKTKGGQFGTTMESVGLIAKSVGAGIIAVATGIKLMIRMVQAFGEQVANIGITTDNFLNADGFMAKARALRAGATSIYDINARLGVETVGILSDAKAAMTGMFEPATKGLTGLAGALYETSDATQTYNQGLGISTTQADENAKAEEARAKALEKTAKAAGSAAKAQERLVGISGDTGIGSAHLHVQYRDKSRAVSQSDMDRFRAGGKKITDYRKTSDYGPRNTGIKGASTNHRGTDFAIPKNTPITTNVGVKGVKTWKDSKGGGYVSTITFEDGVVIDLLHQMPSVMGVDKGATTGNKSMDTALARADSMAQKAAADALRAEQELQSKRLSIAAKWANDKEKIEIEYQKNIAEIKEVHAEGSADYIKYMARLEEDYEKDKNAKLMLISEKYLSEEQRIHNHHQKELREIEAANIEDDTTRQMFIDVQNAMYQKDLDNFKFAAQAKAREQDKYYQSIAQSMRANRLGAASTGLDSMAQRTMSDDDYSVWRLAQDRDESFNSVNSQYKDRQNEINARDERGEFQLPELERFELLEVAKQEHMDAMWAMDQDYALKQQSLDEQLKEKRVAIQESAFGSMTDAAAMFFGENSKMHKAAFAMEKAFAVQKALMNIEETYSNTFNAVSAIPLVGPYLAMPMAIAASAMQIASAANIQGMAAPSVSGIAHGGLDYVPKESTYLLDKGERVLSPNQNSDLTKFMQGGDKSGLTINNYSSARVEASGDGQTITITDVRNEVKRGFTNLQNPNSYESKQINRNVQAPRRR